MTTNETRRGWQMDILNPKPEDVCTEDIAYTLGGLNLDPGAGRFFSAAELAVAAMWHAKERGGTPGQVKLALFHNAASAYVGHLSEPLREAMRTVAHGTSPYDSIEFLIWNKAVGPALGLPCWELPTVVSPAVKRAVEAAQSRPRQGWLPTQAREMFREAVKYADATIEKQRLEEQG